MAWWSWWLRWTGHERVGTDLATRTPERGDPAVLAGTEFPARIAEVLPELQVVAGEDGSLLVYPTVDDDDPIVVNLARMAARLSNPATRAERENAYEQWISVLRQILDGRAVDTEWAERLLVRLVTPEWIAGSAAETNIVAREVEGLDLFSALVFDFPTSVRFVTTADLDKLEMTVDKAYERAMENFRGRLPESVVRDQLREPRVTRYLAMDSYEAARILLIPSLLRPGEAIGAAIPDRDSLLLFPADTQAETVRTLTTASGPDALLAGGVRVTCAGFERLT